MASDDELKNLSTDEKELRNAQGQASDTDRNYAKAFQDFESAEQKLLSQIKENAQTMKSTRQKAKEMDAENLAAKAVEEGGYMTIADALEAQEQENQTKDELRQLEMQNISKSFEASAELFSSGIKLGTTAVDSIGHDLSASGAAQMFGLATVSGFVMNGALDGMFSGFTEAGQAETDQANVDERVEQYENLDNNNDLDEDVEPKYVEGETNPEEYADNAKRDAGYTQGSASDQYNYEDNADGVPAKEIDAGPDDAGNVTSETVEGDYFAMSTSEQQTQLDSMAAGDFMRDMSHVTGNVATIMNKDASIAEKATALTDLVATAGTVMGVNTEGTKAVGKMFGALLDKKDDMDAQDKDNSKDPNEIDLGV